MREKDGDLVADRDDVAVAVSEVVDEKLLVTEMVGVGDGVTDRVDVAEAAQGMQRRSVLGMRALARHNVPGPVGCQTPNSSPPVQV